MFSHKGAQDPFRDVCAPLFRILGKWYNAKRIGIRPRLRRYNAWGFSKRKARCFPRLRPKAASEDKEEYVVQNDGRFEIVLREGSSLTSGLKFVLVDKETGVNYLFVQSGYAGGITPLLDADGKPIVTPRYGR